MDGFTTAPLHHLPEYLLPCCSLLNDQWPRSQTARLQTLERSNDNFPVSLLLICLSNKKLVGHARLAKIPKDPHGCWIESVVISRQLRGKGLGRILLDGCEKYALEHGFKTMYLTTHDQEGFYSHLGFTLCNPISYYGAGTLIVTPKVINGNVKNNVKPLKKVPIAISTNGSLPPPPPPLPEPHSSGSCEPVKVFMKKQIQK